MKRAFIGVALAMTLMGASCPPTPEPTPTPTPTPSPTPTPGAPQFLDLLLRTNGVKLIRPADPTWEPYGAIQCCMPFSTASGATRRPAPFKMLGTPQNSRWPLASETWMDYTGANLFAFRMGPFYADANHESEWADIGGPYLGNGPEWNPTFWQKVRVLVSHAGEMRRTNVEVDVIDTWYCKHAQWGDQQMPWPAADIDACGRRSSQEQERYIRKVVSELSPFGNVVWMTDNEGGEIQGNDCRWFEWVRTIIREEEFRTGGPTRLVGTNNPRCASGPFDYVATHAWAPLTEPIAGKHTENNERNGQPQVTPEEEHSRFCQARALGLHYWYWRAEMTDAQLDQSLALFKAGCGGPQQCFPPPDEPQEMWELLGPGRGTRTDAVRAAQAEVGSQCREPRAHQNGIDALEALARPLRDRGHCAGRASDSLTILGSDGEWEEFHAVSPFDTGCWANDPAFYPKNRWHYRGANPMPPGTCGSPTPPALSRWNVKEHTKGPNRTIVDSTPLVGPDVAYCAAIGFTDGRAFCSVRQEGAADRRACEALIVGTPQWTGPGSVSPENVYQYWVDRGKSGTAKVCASAAPTVCGSVEVTP